MGSTEKDNPLPYPRPEILPPLDREKFAFAWRIAMAAGHLIMPVKNPETYHLNIEWESGETIKIIGILKIHVWP